MFLCSIRKEHKCGLVVPCTLEAGMKVSSMALEHIPTLVRSCTRENLSTDLPTGKARKPTHPVYNMMGIGLTTSLMVKASYN